MKWTALGGLLLLVIAAGSAVAQAPAGALTPERYARIDAVYAASTSLEELNVPQGALTAFRRSCNELGSADPLLAALRRICFADVRAYRAITQAQSCERRCAKLYRKVDAPLRENIKRRRAANPVIVSQVADAGCRAELRTSAADLRALSRIRLVFALLARAERTGSKADVNRADRLLGTLADQPSLTEERASFQQACGPPQPM